MPAPLEPTEPTAGDTETSTWAIIFTSSSSIYLIISIVYFMYCLYAISYYSSTCNPMLLLWYILGLVVLLVIIYNVLSWVIQIYHFCILLVLFYFYSSTHIRYCFWNMWFLLIYSNFISLRRHHFHPVISIAHTTLRTMLSLVGGDSWGRKFFFLLLILSILVI